MADPFTFDPDATQPIIPITDDMLLIYETLFQMDASIGATNAASTLTHQPPVGTQHAASTPTEPEPVGAQHAAPAPDDQDSVEALRESPHAPPTWGEAVGYIHLPSQRLEDLPYFRDMPADQLLNLGGTIAGFLDTARRHHLHREPWYTGLDRLATIIAADLKRHHGY